MAKRRSTSGGSKVVLLGATGLVGGHCLSQLLAEERVTKVVTLTRGPLAAEHKHENHAIDFARLGEKAALLKADAVICALGTTIKKAGSEARFREVDFGIPLLAATEARKLGTPHFLLVSSLGADAKSSVFYSRVKGELEEAIGALGFPRLTIVRPSLLLGSRVEFRLGEEIGKRFAFLVPRRFKPVEASAVAACLVTNVLSAGSGVKAIPSEEIQLGSCARA